MDKKKISTLLSLMMLFCMQGYTQICSDSLIWKQKDKAIGELYDYMSRIVNDTSPIVIKPWGYSLFDYIQWLVQKKKIKRIRTLQRQILQSKTKAYMDSCFVIVNDSVKSFRFSDKNQAIEWGKSIVLSPYTPTEVYPTELSVMKSRILILMFHYGSGIIRMRFYVFRYHDDYWELLTVSNDCKINVVQMKVDDNNEAVFFKSPSGNIGKLSYELLQNK